MERKEQMERMQNSGGGIWSRLRARMGDAVVFLRRRSTDEAAECRRILGGYCLVAYLINIVLTLLFATVVKRWSVGAVLLIAVDVPVYALGYTLPGALLTLLASAAGRSRRSRLTVGGGCGAPGMTARSGYLEAAYRLGNSLR